MKRYSVKAKRKKEKGWSEWTPIDNYQRAIQHFHHVEELGYDAKITINEAGVEELWDLLGGDTELADKIFDAKFRKESRVAKEILAKIHEVIRQAIRQNLDMEEVCEDEVTFITCTGRVDALRNVDNYLDLLKLEYKVGE